MGQNREASGSSSAATPVASLQAALRRARLENAEQSDAVVELRNAEGARLDLLREHLAPIVAQARAHTDMFDLALSQSERPRLFVDMIAFVEMARDRRSYRFVQDTRHGRVLIAENESVDFMTRTIADYIARRLVEREKALAADALFAFQPAQSAPAEAHTAASSREESTALAMRAAASGDGAPPRGRPQALRVFARTLLFVIEVIGSVAFFGLIAAGVWLAVDALR